MRILHVIPAIAPRYGGPSIAIRSLCEAQNRLDAIEIEMATTDADGATQRLSEGDVPREYPVHVFPRTWSERWKYSIGLGGWLKENVRRFDLVHVHAIWTYSSRAAAGVARQSGVPYIVRPAGMLSKWSFSHRSALKAVLWQLGERSYVAGAAQFHATSDDEAMDIRQLIPDAKISVISNGVSSDAWSVTTDPRGTKRKLGIPDDGVPTIVMLSRLHPVKGIADILLPALAGLSVPARLVIAGGPDDHAPEYAAEVKQTVDRLRLNERVVFTGTVQSADRWSYLDIADVFVLPSHSENFGIVVAEAMARGKAVVVTNAVQSWTHVQAARAGAVVPVSADGVRAALEDILGDAQKRCQMAEAGREYAKVHFSWNGIANQVSAMYTAAIQL